MEIEARIAGLEASLAGLSSAFIDLAAIIHEIEPEAIAEALGKRRALVRAAEAGQFGGDVPLQGHRLARDLLERAVARNA